MSSKNPYTEPLAALTQAFQLDIDQQKAASPAKNLLNDRVASTVLLNEAVGELSAIDAEKLRKLLPFLNVVVTARIEMFK